MAFRKLSYIISIGNRRGQLLQTLFRSTTFITRLNSEDIHSHQQERQLPINHISSDVNRKYVLRKLETGLEVHFQTEKNLFLDNLWLRIHCRCSDCYHKKTHQRELTFLDVCETVSPVQATLSESGELKVSWSDNHKSIYDIDWLKANAYQGRKHQSKLIPKLWSKVDWEAKPYPSVDYDRNLEKDQLASQVLLNLITYGFCFIHQAPLTVEECEIVFRKIAPIQTTFWGGMWSTKNDETKSQLDTAFSTGSLPPHNDNTYFSDAAGLQVFSCLRAAEAGGETVLVDGFSAVNCLQRKDPASYDCLTTVPIESTYQDDLGNYFSHYDHVIKLCHITGDLQQIRFNPLDIGAIRTIPPEKLLQFYRSYKSLAKEILSREHEVIIPLKRGSILIIDNWRVLHGRNSFSGERHLCGCYISRGDYISQAKRLGLLT